MTGVPQRNHHVSYKAMYSNFKAYAKRYVRYAYLRSFSDYRRALDRRRPNLRYIGWLGDQNFGDELMFDVFRNFLFSSSSILPSQDLSLLTVMCRGQSSTQVVLGGGTLINDGGHLAPLESARRCRIPYFVFGTGVSDPAYWASHPTKRVIDTAGWLRTLGGAYYVGVRGPQSYDWLRKNGIKPTEILGDPALSIKIPVPKSGDGPAILGVNLGAHDPVSGIAGSDFIAVTNLILHAIRIGWTVKYLSLHPIDHKIGQRLLAIVRRKEFSVPAFDSNTSRQLAGIACCDCIIGQRLHATIVASALSIPNLSLSYQPKCLDFLESIGREDLAVRTDEISSSSLIERFEWLVDSRDTISKQLKVRCDEFRAMQMRRAAELTANF